MKLIKLLFITSILIISHYAKAQFFAGFNTGYDFSLAKAGDGVLMNDPLPIDKYNSSMYMHPMRYYSEDKELISIKPYLGSGIVNEISIGYKACILGVKLSVGTNNNAVNFKNKNNVIGRQESKTFYDINSPDMSFIWDDGFDGFMTVENSYSLDFRYSIFYVNPEILASYDFGKITIGATSGIRFNFIDMAVYGKTIMNGYNDSYSKTITYESTFLFNPDKETLETLFMGAKPEKATISYTLGLNVGYKLDEHIELNCNVRYRPLFYAPINLFVCENKTTINENGQVTEYEDEDMPSPLSNNTFLHNDGFWFEIREYNFSTIGVSVGIKYMFDKK